MNNTIKYGVYYKSPIIGDGLCNGLSVDDADLSKWQRILSDATTNDINAAFRYYANCLSLKDDQPHQYVKYEVREVK